MLHVFKDALILIIKKLLPSICPSRDGEGQREGTGLPGAGAAAPRCSPWGKTELRPAVVPRQRKCTLLPSRWEIPFRTDSMLPQKMMGFHTAGLVQALGVSLGFLVWEKDREPRKGEQVIRDFSEGLREELENLDRNKSAVFIGQHHLFP